MITQDRYINWQAKLGSSVLFKRWWQFWSNYAFVWFIVAGVFLRTREDFVQMVILGGASFVIARWVVTQGINYFYKKQRPYQKFSFNPITSKFFSWQTTIPNSFPSRHTVSFTSVAVVVIFFSPFIGLLLVLATLMTGLGRVRLGYHWPIDIIGGLIIGAIIGSTVAILGGRLFFT